MWSLPRRTRSIPTMVMSQGDLKYTKTVTGGRIDGHPWEAGSHPTDATGSTISSSTTSCQSMPCRQSKRPVSLIVLEEDRAPVVHTVISGGLQDQDDGDGNFGDSEADLLSPPVVVVEQQASR